MKKVSKKLLGGFIVVILVATIGAIFASAQSDDETEMDTPEQYNRCFREPGFMHIGDRNLFYELTDEQEEEIVQLKETMIADGATCEEIKEVIMQKLDEWGILDNRLDNAIEQTEQRLEILNRQKELREQGYSWEEINDIIKEEYELESFPGYSPGMDFESGFHKGKCRGFRWGNLKKIWDMTYYISSTINFEKGFFPSHSFNFYPPKEKGEKNGRI